MPKATAHSTLADTLTGTLRDSNVIARPSGDEFAVLPSATDPVERVTQAPALRNAADASGYAIRFGVGNVACDPARHHAVADLLASADHRVYEDKQRGKTTGT
ncbi:diguanylate cyclase domain-containing protein [Burkholderia pyrrocinia]|uniref:diguanylate cyclase domain-containing protein n=1 Tax=Burkholderia pyrrocinia TaxID=60550 RepID=UPI003D9A5D18